MEKSEVEEPSSTVLATVEEIQKRLVRPTNSQPLSNFFTSNSHNRVNNNATGQNSPHQLQKIREVESRKLEDYLDPILLSAVRAKVNGGKLRKRVYKEEKAWTGYLNDFDKFEQWRMNRKTKFERNEAVDLKNDCDSIGDGEDDDRIFCTPFMQFETTALKRLGG